jgi:basic membrane protein A and related proteins
VHGKAITVPPAGGWLPSFSSLARQKYDLIIGLGRDQAADLDTAARRFPDRKFLILDTTWEDLRHRPRNVLGSDWRVEEPSYLAGYLAGLMEKRRPGKDVIGTVGGYPIPSVKRFIAGFDAGARKADPGITTLRAYSFDFFDPAKCEAVALRQIGQGAGVVFNVAGACGLGVLDAAKRGHVWGVGVDVDQSSLGPHILTSVVKRWDVEVFDTVEALVHGKLRTGRDSVWNLRTGAVRLGRISPKVPPPFVRRVERIRRQIVAGKLHVPAVLS